MTVVRLTRLCRVWTQTDRSGSGDLVISQQELVFSRCFCVFFDAVRLCLLGCVARHLSGIAESGGTLIKINLLMQPFSNCSVLSVESSVSLAYVCTTKTATRLGNLCNAATSLLSAIAGFAVV